MDTPKVAISIDFFKSMMSLSKEAQKKVPEFLYKFFANPNSRGINYEKIDKTTDKGFYSVRIDRAYRAIVKRCPEDNIYLLLWVDHHDEAYAWASRRKDSINKATQGIQVYPVNEWAYEKQADKKYIFDAFTDEQLLRIGLPEEQLPMVKSIETVEELYAMKDDLPEDPYLGLSILADGEDYNVVIKELKELCGEEAGVVGDEDFAEALQSDASRKYFVIVDSEEELRRIMEGSLEQWRIFLHPTQRRIVNKDYSGSARISGGAGTGKTVVAMHRAVKMAENLPAGKKVLFTTFTKNLADDIQENLKKIASADQMKRIEVTNLHAWMADFLKSRNYEYKILYGRELDDIWDGVIERAGKGLEYTRQFYMDEWLKAVHAQEAYTQEKYLGILRAGRGTPLDRSKRMAVWRVFEEFMNTMDAQKVRDAEYAMYECRCILNNGQTPPFPAGIYENIIVDEGQDLSPNAYRLIRALAGEPHKNDIFIVGDAHQRIYKNKAILSQCGINVRGRVDKLRINYRTTEEIRKYACGILGGVSFDDMDEGYDDNDHFHSLTHGSAPEIMQFSTPAEEMEFIAKEIKALEAEGVPLKNICIVARTRELVKTYREGLQNLKTNKLNIFSIKKDKADDGSIDGVRIATMHRVKGLEFDYIFVAGADSKTLPNAARKEFFDDASFEEFKTEEKCLLYVALTRARKGAYVTCHGSMSNLVK